MPTDKEFINSWAKKHSASIKNFPDAFLDGVEAAETIMPGTRLNLGQEMFGSYEVVDNKGNTFRMVNSAIEAKYFIYASRLKASKVLVPIELPALNKAVSEYEKYIDTMIKSIRKAYSEEIPDGKNPNDAVNQIFFQLDLVRF